MGGGAGGLGSGRLSERVTTVTPTLGLELNSMPLQTRPSTAGNCLGSVHAEHPANLPLLSIAHEGTGRCGVAGVEPEEEATAGPAPQNRGPTMSPFLMGLLPNSFLHLVSRITLEH